MNTYSKIIVKVIAKLKCGLSDEAKHSLLWLKIDVGIHHRNYKTICLLTDLTMPKDFGSFFSHFLG